MNSVYDFDDYKKFVIDRIKAKGSAGRGEYKKIAEYLKINSTMVSQIFKGSKVLNPDHAFKLTTYFGFNDLEREYFLTLVQIERAGNFDYKNYLTEQLQKLKRKSEDLSKRLPKSKTLSDEDQAIYYSEWYYSAVGLPKHLIQKVIRFLLEKGLLIQEDSGIYRPTELRTYLPGSSSLIGRHHNNWRLKNMERTSLLDEDELMYTAPLSISKKDVPIIKKEIVKLIEKLNSVVNETNPEELRTFICDWVKVRK